MENKSIKREELNIPVMILCIVGVVLTVFGFLVLKNDNFKLRVISTQGTVTGITVSRNSDGDIAQRTITLSYIAANSSYKATINNYSEDIDMGSKITLYYDFLSPTSVDSKRSGYIGYLAAIFGVILVIKTGPKFVRIIKDNYL